MIYFDNSATTKPCDAAIAAAENAMRTVWGNPSSAHSAGGEARRLLERCSRSVASSMGIRRSGMGRLIFLSSGTEANNLAINGVINAKARPEKNGRRGTVIITSGEHASVESTAENLEKNGFNVLRIPTAGGKLDLEWLKKNVTKDVIIASMMLVNNETGAVYDVKKASDIIRAASPAAIIHSDCVQAYMKIPIAPSLIGADMISVSAHKIFSLKGSAALFLSESIIKSRNISPVIFGGGQGEGLHGGTESVPAIAAFGAAAEEGMMELDTREKRIGEISRYAEKRLKEIDGVKLNLPEKRLPSILSMTVTGIKSETMLNFLSAAGICVSKSSACSARSRNLSPALLSFGLSETDTDSTLRLSFSHLNTESEVDTFVKELTRGISSLARIKK